MAEAVVLEAPRKTVNDWQVKRICLQEFGALLQWMEELQNSKPPEAVSMSFEFHLDAIAWLVRTGMLR